MTEHAVVPFRARPGATVAVLVVATTVVRFAVARQFTVPWIAPDEMLYGLLGESLWEHGTLAVRGMESPYYSFLTPALVGAGLELGGRGWGVELAQLLQTAAVSSAAIPAYLWARRVAPAWWAVAAAAITLATPAVLYGGLLMTEALFYPATVWAAFALALALERPTLLRQGVFLGATTAAAAVRMQALVLLPACALAVWLYPRLGAPAKAVRPLVPLAASVGALAIVIVLLELVAPGVLRSTQILGGYAALGDAGERTGGLPLALVRHLGALVVASVAIPAVASALLVVAARRRKPLTSAARALAATGSAYVLLLVAQVGLFAAGHLDHVGQRYTATALPILAVGLAGWVGAGCPRGGLWPVLVVATLVVTVAALPLAQVAPELGVHDAIPTAYLGHLVAHETVTRIGLVLATVAGAALVLWLPRRLVAVLPVIVIVLLVAMSVDASRTVVNRSAAEERSARGTVERSWLDDQTDRPVTLLLTGARAAPTEARTVFWNRSVAEVIALPNVVGVVPPSPLRVRIDDGSGLLLDAGGATMSRGLLAAPSTVNLEGDVVATMPLGESASPPLRLWKPSVPIRVVSELSGVLPNGDFTGRADLHVPGCRRGALVVTLLGKSGDPINVAVDGIPREPIEVAAGEVKTVSIPAPSSADGTRSCTFTLSIDGYAGSTQFTYTPASP